MFEKVLVTGSAVITNKYINNQLLTVNRNHQGKFERIRNEWSLENFDDGYIDNRGRFRVWMPTHPRSYNEGYILRAIVTYEKYHNVIVPKEMDIHHKDGNRLNDSIENLEMLSHGRHAVLTQSKRTLESQITKICEHCKNTFIIKRGRLNDRTRASRFCSLSCYHKHGKSEEHRKRIGESRKLAYQRDKNV